MTRNRTVPARRVAALAAALVLLAGAQASAQERFPPIPESQLTEAQKQAVDNLREARGTGLGGPWTPLLRSPELLNRTRAMGDYLRFRSALPPRLSEFVILIAGRHWSSAYEWYAHHPLAIKGGLKPEITRALAEGRRPDAMAPDEAAVYDFATELHRNHMVSDATFARAVDLLGEQGVMDMIGLSGYYTLISMVLNTARVPLPEGAPEPIRPFPH